MRFVGTEQVRGNMTGEFFGNWGLLLLATLAALMVVLRWIVERSRHMALIRSIPTRIHVNGIRGKSTATRYIAAALRQAGMETVAKTTGSATRVIDENGDEHPVKRIGAPTIIEQISLLRQHAKTSTEAIVFECMALRPEYQHVSEHQIMHSTAGVLLNVRRDHVEELGETLPEIANSLSNTIPANAPLFTAEQDYADLLVRQAERVDAEVLVVDPDTVSREEMGALGPFVFRENVAVALAVAEHVGVDRAVALKGVQNAADDPGASKFFEHEISGRRVFWVDLFGINDPQSAKANVDRFIEWLDEDPAVVIILNNRDDRQNRTREFTDFLASELTFDRAILTGAFQDVVASDLRERGVEDEKLIVVQDDELDVDSLLEDVLSGLDGDPVVLFGLANIHTEAADRFRERLEREM